VKAVKAVKALENTPLITWIRNYEIFV